MSFTQSGRSCQSEPHLAVLAAVSSLKGRPFGFDHIELKQRKIFIHLLKTSCCCFFLEGIYH